MSVHCDFILKWDATPDQLTALGRALWGWCIRVAGGTGIYQYLDHQKLADLIAGKFPLAGQIPSQADFRVRDHLSHERQATIDRLRREIPVEGVEDILVEGKSWNQTG